MIEGAVMDIVVWLRSLGLGKYEAAFRENEIDETILPTLTHENLKELGVTALGHRLKLLDAIAALRADTLGQSARLRVPIRLDQASESRSVHAILRLSESEFRDWSILTTS